MDFTKVGGYDCEISTEKYNCDLCKKLLREPHQTSCCGEHACASCITPYVDATGAAPCPLCGEQGFTVFLDKKWMREVMDQDVRCDLHPEGCNWAGKLRDYEQHVVQDCRYVAIECPKECGGRIKRLKLYEHLSTVCPKRPYHCQYCGFDGMHEDVVRHWEKCEKFPEACPNGCTTDIVERCHLEQHLSECPLQRIPCEFRKQGCTARVLRKDYTSHMEENVQTHLKSFASFCDALKQDLPAHLEKQLTSSCADHSQQLSQLQSSLSDSQAEVAELQRDMAEKDKKIDRLEALISETGDQMTKLVQKVEGELGTFRCSVEQALKDKDRQNQELVERLRAQESQMRELEENLRVQGELTTSLTSEYGGQLEETDPASASPRRQSVRSDNVDAGPVDVQHPPLPPNSRPQRPPSPSDSPPRSPALSHYTTDVTLNIGDPPKSGSHCSSPFTFSKGSYEMKMDAYLKNQELSVHLYNLRGDNDHRLKWPLCRHVVVQLVSPQGGVYTKELELGKWDRVEKPTQFQGNHQRISPFISLSELPAYTSPDGTLHFRVSMH